MLEMFISCIDDGTYFFRCNISLNDLNGLTSLYHAFYKGSIHANILPPLKILVGISSRPKNYFVFATTAANACGSRIAMSDSILRLRSIFAFFNAATSLLYVVPFRRAAALMRAIHNLRRSRLRTRRSRVAYQRLLSIASLARLNRRCFAPRCPFVILKIFL